MDEELKIGILEKNGNAQGDSSKIVNRNTQVQFVDLLKLDFSFLEISVYCTF